MWVIVGVIFLLSFSYEAYKLFVRRKQDLIDVEIMRDGKLVSENSANDFDSLREKLQILDASSQSDPIDEISQSYSFETQIVALVNEAVSQALRILSKHKEHIPFSILLNKNGKLQYVVPDDTEKVGEDLGEILFNSVSHATITHASFGTIKALVIARHGYLDNEIGDSKTGVVELHVEYASRKAFEMIVPYVRKADSLVFAYHGTILPSHPIYLNS
jgi:hypothetical protein